MKDVCVIIPAYNEETKIAEVVKAVRKNKFQVIVIDDSSTDNTAKVAKKAKATVISHKRNQGAGAATRTGIKAALKTKAEYIVTIDADGQHNPKEISRLLKYASRYDVIIGSRMIKPKGMPISRKIFNWGGSIITYLLYGIYVKDSQSGFKIFNAKAAKAIDITENRYEFCSEMLYEIKRNKLTYKEVPISVIYTKYSLEKRHGQSFINGLQMIGRMIALKNKKELRK